MTELMKRMEAYTGDIRPTMELFLGDEGLYQECMMDFREDPAFAALEEAIKAEDYQAAFEAAHSLKGVSGNLGLTPLYEKICTLVESLRGGNYDHVAADYDAVKKEEAVFKGILQEVT